METAMYFVLMSALRPHGIFPTQEAADAYLHKTHPLSTIVETACGADRHYLVDDQEFVVARARLVEESTSRRPAHFGRTRQPGRRSLAALRG